LLTFILNAHPRGNYPESGVSRDLSPPKTFCREPQHVRVKSARKVRRAVLATLSIHA